MKCVSKYVSDIAQYGLGPFYAIVSSHFPRNKYMKIYYSKNVLTDSA